MIFPAHLSLYVVHTTQAQVAYPTIARSYPTAPTAPTAAHAIIQTASRLQVTILSILNFEAQHGHPQTVPRRLLVYRRWPATLSAA
jgi:hypothetical protein